MTKVAYLWLLAGCAITAKSQPLEFRYFSPAPSARAAAHTSEPPCARLRLGRVTPGAYLQFRIAHRASAVELDLYETLRWTERPDTYVRRALSDALFEHQPLHLLERDDVDLQRHRVVRNRLFQRLPLEQAIADDAVTLEIDVIAFEEVQRQGRHGGRVQLGYALRDARNVLDRGVVTFERDARGAAIEQVVTAIGVALEAASAEVARRVSLQVCRTTPVDQER
jgi:hypothetical protein